MGTDARDGSLVIGKVMCLVFTFFVLEIISQDKFVCDIIIKIVLFLKRILEISKSCTLVGNTFTPLAFFKNGIDKGV